MTDRKMCKFYNLNVPDRRSGDGGRLPYEPEIPPDDEDDDQQPPNDEDAPPQIPDHHHKLEYCYSLWFSRLPPVRELNVNSEGYGQALRFVASIGSVEQWWGVYCHLARPSELPPLTDLHLFKLGIKPLWEDPANVQGGKWVVRLRKGQTDRAWEDLCMAMLGEQFMVGSEICGIVLCVRFQEDLLSMWHRTSADETATNRIRDTLRRVLHLPSGHPMEYKVHGDCLRATTSRNLEQIDERNEDRVENHTEEHNGDENDTGSSSTHDS